MTRQDPRSLGSTESTARGRANDTSDAPLVRIPSVDQCRSGVNTAARRSYTILVPVVDRDQKPLMPTTPSRARRWVKTGEATPFFKKGIFCIRLNREPSARKTQRIAVGIDPGSKREGYTIKSKAHTYLNILADAVMHVKDSVEVRRNMRRSRRFRKTPCRKNRQNRSRGSLPPSTKARWQWKLRVLDQITKIFPVTDVIVEDIQAGTRKGQRRWNSSFSPLEVGKTWFYEGLHKYGNVFIKPGYETKDLRDAAGLKKSSSKLADVFSAHCVDSWVLANFIVEGHVVPDNTSMLRIAPIRLHRRQLHAMQPAKGGLRRPYGGTRSLGFKRGSLVMHPKYGFVYVGGTMGKRISLHSVSTGERLCRNAKAEDLVFKSYNTWKVATILDRASLLPGLKAGVPALDAGDL